MTDFTTRTHAAHTVAAMLKEEGTDNPETKTIICLLDQLGITGNDAALTAPLVRALLADDHSDRASATPLTVADVIDILSQWPQHALVRIPDTDGVARTLTDLDIQTAHAAYMTPVLVLNPAMRAPELKPES